MLGFKLNHVSKRGHWRRMYASVHWVVSGPVNESSSEQNGHHFSDNILKFIFMNEKFCISIWVSLNFVPKGPNDNKSALVQVMAWCRIGYMPLREPLLTHFTTHICSTGGKQVNESPMRPQSRNQWWPIVNCTPTTTIPTEICIKMKTFPFMKLHSQLSSAKFQPFHSGRGVIDKRKERLRRWWIHLFSINSQYAQSWVEHVEIWFLVPFPDVGHCKHWGLLCK